MTLGRIDNGIGRCTVVTQVMDGVTSFGIGLGEDAGVGTMNGNNDGLGWVEGTDGIDEG